MEQKPKILCEKTRELTNDKSYYFIIDSLKSRLDFLQHLGCNIMQLTPITGTKDS